MTINISREDQTIISLFQGDIPLVERPYKVLAREAGLTEEAFLDKLKFFKEKGVLRRAGAIVRHYRAGYTSNVMVCWQVEEERVEEAGKAMAHYRDISHIYQRPAFPPHWPYNLFTMVHGRDEGQTRELIQRISRETGLQDYQLLKSVREFKKTSMEYFKGEICQDGPT